MAQGNVIKEFLVALGFKTDEAALKKLTDGVTTATKSVLILGTAIEASAVAVAAGVARFASNLEQLYFAAQRTSSSADSLKAFDLAARNFGASIDEAQGSVESLAAFLRNNPGGANVIAGWLGAVGLSARGANGEMLQGTALMAQLGKMFAIQRGQGRTFLANQMAGMLGISDKTMLAMSTPGFAQELEAQEKRAKGWEAVAKAAHAFMIQLEDLKMSFYQMMLGFEGPAMHALQGLMTQFSRFMRDHGKQIVTDLSAAFTWVIHGIGDLLDWLDKHGKEMIVRLEALWLELNFDFTLHVKPVFEWLWTQFVKLDEVTGGWSTKVIAITAALKALGATGIITGIVGLGAGLSKAAGAVLGLGVGEAATGWAAAGTAFGVAAWGALGFGLGYLLDKYFPNNPLAKAGHALGEFIGDAMDQYHAFYKMQHENYAVEKYISNPARAAALNAAYSPKIGIDIDINVNGSSDPRAVGHHVANEAEAAIRRAGYALSADLTREFLATVK